jgi:hypothetical protein
MKRSIFWDITPCSPLKINRHLRETCLLYLYGLRINQARNQPEAGSKQSLLSQKTELFIITFVRTSDPTYEYWVD